jgi:hypothetical protein
MSARAKAKELLAAMASHHLEMAKAHQAECDKADGMENASDFHKAGCASHTTMAEAIVKCSKAMNDGELEKAFGSSRGSEMVPLPEGLSTVAPDLPSNIRAVPRYGQREITSGNRTDLPPEFQKIISVD